VFNKDVPYVAQQEAVNKAREFVSTAIPLGNYTKEGRALMHFLGKDSEADSYYSLFNTHQNFGDRNTRLYTLGDIRKIEVPLEIVRKNQQYQLYVNFGFMGSAELATAFEIKQINKFNSKCAPGFSAGKKIVQELNEKPNLIGIVGLIIVIIFFITSILFESFRQSLWVIVMIPFSYIGIFLTFGLFGIKFDQGGYAAFILLGGITVNASIYLLNSFNNTPTTTSITRRYIKAWNTTITPIFLTILSTILGFIPFLIKGSEVFWKALAAGVIGGLIFSLVVITLLLPLSLNKNK
jgi:multidrug efflux pump subunit AcrB